MRTLPFRIAGALTAASLMMVLGCGPSTSNVTGTVDFGAEKMADGDKVAVQLESTSGKRYNGEADSSGKFTITGVEAGKYKVTATHYVVGSTGPDQPKTGSSNAPVTSNRSPPPGTPPAAGGPARPAGRNMPRLYPEEWTVPGGPYKLEMSKLAK